MADLACVRRGEDAAADGRCGELSRKSNSSRSTVRDDRSVPLSMPSPDSPQEVQQDAFLH